MKIALAFVLVISGFVPCLLPAQRASRSENPVGTIYQDKSGYHWRVEGEKKLLRFSNYSTKHGLANNLVNDLIRDSSGFLWIYSPGGISRFDGVEFKNYAFPYHGYDGNYFALDKQANLWATDGIDLFTFNRKLDKFEQVALAGASREGMSFIQSYSQGTEIWFREGVDLYKIETGNSLSIRQMKEGLPPAVPEFNYRDKKGRFWFGDLGQVQLYFPKQDSIVLIPTGKDTWPHRFIEDNDDGMWFSDGVSGISLLNLSSLQIRSFPKKGVQNNYYDLTYFPALSGDSVLWTNGKFYQGIELFSKRTKKYVGNHLHDPLNEQSLADNVTYNVHSDREGILWAGTAGGFSMAHPRQQHAIRYLLPDRAGNMTPRAVYRHRHEMPDDAIVFFDTGKLIYFYQGKARSMSDRKLGLWSEKYRTIYACFDPAGRLWVGTPTGLHRIDRRLGSIAESFIISPEGNAFLNKLVPDQEGNLWLGFGGRLARWNMRNKKMMIFPTVAGDLHFLQEDESIDRIVVSQNNRLWLSVTDRIICFNPLTGRVIRRYTFPDLPRLNRRPAVIQDFGIDRRGNIWLGLNSGIVRVDTATGQYRMAFFPRKDTTSAMHLTDLLADDDNNIWAATYSGVYCYMPDAGRFVHLDERDDLASNIVYHIGRVCDRIFAYHANGKMDIINPRLALAPLPVPPVYITGYKVGDRILPFDWHSDTSNSIQLSYRDNILSFLYTAVDFAAPQKISYQYRLDGFDDNWHEAGPRREITYTNLGGGHYTFRVRAINGDGVVSPREGVMKIYVHPPYWATWWFRSLLTLTFIALVYAIFRYREIQRLEQEKLRLRIARDLHDEMGSTLSSISILSEAALRHLQADIDRARFGAIGERARQVMEAMSDIVWSVNPRNDNMANVLRRMKEFAVEILEPQGIALHFEADEAVAALDLPMEQRKDFYLLFKEAVNNAAKYSGASGVWVTVRAENGGLALEVRDNGRGFDPEQVKRGNGLWNMERRAERMGKRFGLESRVGEGTRVSISL